MKQNSLDSSHHHAFIDQSLTNNYLVINCEDDGILPCSVKPYWNNIGNPDAANLLYQVLQVFKNWKKILLADSNSLNMQAGSICAKVFV